MTEPRHIDLHLPTGWNQCTTAELEMIAAAMLTCQARQDRYHPFDPVQVKVLAVLMINEMTVIESQELEAEDSVWTVRRPQDTEPWRLTAGQMMALCDNLNWIYDDSSQPLFIFPYPEMRLEVRGKRLEVSGPPPLLDGYTWREYRLLQDWMSLYMRQQNNLIKVTTLRRHDKEAIQRYQESISQAQREFLAVLFRNGKDNGNDNSHLSPLTSNIFKDFSPIKWQAILFWWSGLMTQLAKKFPRVFKSQPVGKHRPQKQDMPWDFYNRVTATIQKYVGGLSAQDVDSQPYGVTLQQLEMMAMESEELEKMKKK